MANTMRQQEKKKKISGLHLKIMAAALVPMVVMAVMVGVCAGKNIRSALRQQMMVGLETGAQSMEAHYHMMNDSPFSVSSDGKLMKGDCNLTDDTAFLDDLSEQSGLELTVFYGDTRKATTLKDADTGERIIDTTADADVVEKVVNQGKRVENYDLTINGKKYYACYIPLENVDGSTIGMLFAGRSAVEEEAFIRSKITIIVVVEVIFLLIAAVVVFMITKGIQKGIFAAEKAVSGLANGDLSTELDAKFVRRKDELGDMAKGVVILLQQLIEVVQSIKTSSEKLLKSGTELSQMAAQTSTTTDDISKAVEDISSGAVSQANEIETASFEIDAMGQLISRIAANAAELDAGTKEIKNTSDRSMEIVQELSLSNDRSMEAVRRIAQDVNATNESANRISTAVDLITSIAEETNLLSLNASIEAARAGEQGRGFAVVAGQIQKLAEQSNESANSIAEIIQNLLSNSENTVRVMDEVQSIMNEQQRKLDETRKQFEMVSQGVSAASEAASVIRQQTDGCNSARANVVDVISNLSAISEENAASTQQTTASMQELNATISILAEEAQKLQDLSKGMEEDISFFRLAGTHVMESVHSHFDEEEASATFQEDFPVDEEMPEHFTDSEE